MTRLEVCIRLRNRLRRCYALVAELVKQKRARRGGEMGERDKQRRPVTIRHIAERAGVHPSTVSRALRRSPDEDDASARIWAIARELGYQPDVAAASLRTGSSRAIGVLVHNLTDVVQALIFEGIEKAALEFGYQAFVANTYDELSEQKRRVELMLSRRIDGLILADAHLDGAYVDWVEAQGVPFVLASRRCGDRPAVTLDEHLGGRLAGTHIADLGHERVGVLSGLPFSSATTGRTQGCLDALRERGIAVPPEQVEPCMLDAGSGREAMERLLDRVPGITAVFAVNDFTALGAASELVRRGLMPGQDVALVGYNDIPIAAATQLTTIRSPHGSMGSLATHQLIDALAGRSVHDVHLAPALMARQTTLGPQRPGSRA
jgi:LacI family transcriptional regulator